MALSALRSPLAGFQLSARRRAALSVQAFRFVELPTQFALSVLAARALLPSSFGAVTLLISAQAAYVAVATFGFDELIQRNLAHRGVSEPAVILATAARARAISAAAGLALGATGGLIASVTGAHLALAFVYLGVASAAMVAANGYTAVGLAWYDVTLNSLASLLSWVIPVTLVIVGLVTNTTSYMAALAVGAVTRLVVSSYWGWRRGIAVGAIRDRLAAAPRHLDTVRSHVSLVAYNITDLVLARHGDVFAAGLVGLTAASIGAYGLAFQITATCNQVLLLGLGAVGLTRLSEHRDDKLALRDAWTKLTAIAATLAAGPLCVILLTAPELVKYLLGARYPNLVGGIEALVASQWMARIGGGGTNIAALLAIGRTGYVAQSAIAGAAMNVALDLALAPWLGIYGLAVGSGVSVLLVGIVNIRSLIGALGGDASHTARRRLAAIRARWRGFPYRTLGVLTGAVALAEAAAVGGASEAARLSMAMVMTAAWLVACAYELRREI
jgi:O-antigen/teichoic acid export membrane protein